MNRGSSGGDASTAVGVVSKQWLESNIEDNIGA